MWQFTELPQDLIEFRVAAFNSAGTGEFAAYDKVVSIGGGNLLYFSRNKLLNFLLKID